MCKIYERHLKAERPGETKISYDLTDLFAYIDALPDMAALVLDESSGTYRPHTKEWVKETILASLQQQVAAGNGA